jgi:hypothetical protein
MTRAMLPLRRSANQSRGRFGGTPLIMVAGAASAALYLSSLLTQRAMFRNGLHSDVLFPDPGNAADRSALLWQYGGYLISTLGLFALYALVLIRCRRGELGRGMERAWSLAFPILFNLLLIPVAPHLSRDIFSYMAHGYLAQLPGGNPFLSPASDAANTTIGPQLTAYGWAPGAGIGITPYGVLWTRIEILVMGLTNAVSTALLLLKVMVVAASLATALFIWWFLGRTNPHLQMLGTLGYLWNPLVVVEFAGEGHNDPVLILFVLGTLVACATMRPAVAVASLVLGISVKYLPAMFVPAVLAYLWRAYQGRDGRLAIQILVGLVVGTGLTAILYLPLWAGSETFQGVLARGQPISSASPAGVVNWIIMRSQLRPISGTLTLVLVTIPALAFMLWASIRVRDAAGLGRALVLVSLAFVLVASPDYWPWYLGLPVALIAAAFPDRALWVAFVLTLFGRLCAPLDTLFENGFITFPLAKGLTTGLGTTLPLTVLASWGIVAWRRRFQLTVTCD